MQIGVSSYSFSRLMDSEHTHVWAAQEAGRIGYDVFEVQGLQAPQGMTREAYALEVRKACEQAGIQVGNYTVEGDLINAFDGDMKKEIARLKGEVDLAVILGSKGMRHDATYGYHAPRLGRRSFEDALPQLAEGCREITEYAAARGIRTMVENHGFFCQDSERVEKLVNAVAHENFGLLLDMGNFLCADEDPAFAFGRLAPYAFHIHAKDFHVKPGNARNPGPGWFRSRAGNYLGGTVAGFGDVPVAQCLGIVKRAGYEGTVSLEFEGFEAVLWAIEAGYTNLKEIIAGL